METYEPPSSASLNVVKRLSMRGEPPNNAVIRIATFDDASALSDLGSRTFVAAFAAQIDPANLSAYVDTAFNTTRLEAELRTPDSTFLLADSPSGLLGYARTAVDPVPPQVPFERALRLVRLYVDPEHIGTGLGRELLGACDSLARTNGHNALWLRVWEHNALAIHFYERNGFERCAMVDFEMLGSIKIDWVMWRRVRAVA